MARYQKPPDPRESDLKPRRERRQRHDGNSGFPWLWFGLGILVTVLGIVMALALVNTLLSREPLATTLATPTIIRLTAPPSPIPSATAELPTPTPIPTLTPVPTRDLTSPPDEVTVGYYAQVSGTGELGLTIRGGPSTDNVRIQRAAEGTLMLVIGGPEEGGDYTWWQVRLLDGTEGWVAGDFLAPARAPDAEPTAQTEES
ncbi:MAG TPA: SH3 domain-containing protein [Candidatus Binatia bacterium]|jgi:hypothetical protein|nr:SH3 domain-containing protein [Candidatus Binatia bacterium]